MPYCIYLRKSRKDVEAELHGEGETLARHERMLLTTAKRLNLTITQIYKEIVSGETIAARPVMQQLLLEVEQGLWDGVLVAEIERLARGDTRDQGYVAEAFTYSDTKIITPMKTYDPRDPSDQEYFEFSLFMSRREYKTINRRLEAGRLASFREGKYIGNVAPYGWERFKLPAQKGFSIRPHPEESPVLHLIYEWAGYGCGGKLLGTSKIGSKLDSMGIKPRKGDFWTPASIRDIIANEHNIGMVRYQRRKTQRSIVGGIVQKSRPRMEEYMLAQGLHEAQISKELFDLANRNISNGDPRLPESYKLKNPLAGILICSECHHAMTRKANTGRYRFETLNCTHTGCKTVGSPLYLIEDLLIKTLEEWLEGYETETPETTTRLQASIELKQKLLSEKQEILDKTTAQREGLYDFLEQGIYTTEVFLKRSDLLESKLLGLEEEVCAIEDEILYEEQLIANQTTFAPKCQRLIDNYKHLSIDKKNEMLHDLLEKVEYKKLEKNKRGQAECPNFELHIYPKLPKISKKC